MVFNKGDIIIHNGKGNVNWAGIKIEFLHYNMFDHAVGILLQDVPNESFHKGDKVNVASSNCKKYSNKKQHLPEWF